MFTFITSTIEQFGYSGVFFLMFLENIFPPIPSEVIMPLAGYVAATGALNPWGVLVAGTLGSIVGAYPWYYLGHTFGIMRIRALLTGRFGRWIPFTPLDVDNAKKWFEHYGVRAVFFGRLIPTIRTLISIPAGLVAMPKLQFYGYTALGSALWVGFLEAAGYLLESNYALVESYINPVTFLLIAGIVALYIYKVITFRAK